MILRKGILRFKWKWNDLLHTFGIPFRANSTPGELRVICFHGVCEDNISFINSRFLKMHQFEALLNGIARHFHVVSLEDVLNQKLHSDRLNVLLTFDDGYENNKSMVLPVLEKHLFPATIFCTSETLLWTDLIDIARAVELSPEVIAVKFPELQGKSIEQIKHWGIEQSKGTLDSLTIVLKKSLEEHLLAYESFYRLLSDDELRFLQEHPLISLANHGGSHLSYTAITSEDILRDIESGAKRLTAIGSPYSNVFAYPYGHYSTSTKELLDTHQYDVQFIADGNANATEGFQDRLVVNPYISTRNQLIAIRNGKY